MAWLFFIGVFIASFAVPTGAIFLIVSFFAVSHGQYDILLIFALVLLATISGDLAVYFISLRLSDRFERLISKNAWIKNKEEKVKKIFLRYGTYTVFLSRFLLSGVGPYINYYSGLRKMDKKTFIVSAISGEIVYATMCFIIGFAFKDIWRDLLNLSKDYTWLAFLTVVVVYIMFRFLKAAIEVRVK